MKNRVIIICAFVAAFILAGCQKEKEVIPVETTHSVTFTVEKMVDTRTAIDSEGNGVVSYKWIEGDDERMEILELYEVEENGVTKTKGNPGTITGMTISNNGKSATFTAEFTGAAPSGTFGYQAAYSGSFATSSHNPKIPAEQSPLPTSFDPAADVLVSDVFEGGRETTSFVFNMTRKVSINKMTLKGLTPGEVISSVTFESDKQHAATYTMLSSGGYNGEGKKLTFTYTSNNTVPSSGEFPVYFTTAPVENATFTVTVITDQHKYRKVSTRTISFATGEVRRFGVNLSGCEVPDGRAFTLVEDVDDLVIGSDIVIAADGTKNLAMSQTQNGNNRGVADATKSTDGKTIEVVEQTVQIFTLSAGTQTGTYAFLCSNGITAGQYLYAASSTNNYLRSQDNLDANASWTISISDKEATITAQGTNTRNILRYNPGNNGSNNMFSCYASGQQPVYLYQAAGLPAANLSFTEPSYTFTLGDSDYTSFTGQTLNNPNSISDITWTSSNESLATVSDGVITWIPDATGTTTITATFAGDDFFGAGNASYTIIVNAPTQSTSLPFIETFANCTGEAGWSGGAGAGTFVPDHEDWFVSSAHGANGAAKFGTGSVLGSAETPQIEYSGNATLTFKAGAWNGNSESTNLKLSVSSGALYGDASLTTSISSVTLSKGAWSEYTVYLKDLVSPFTVTFEGNAASNSRFFLDDVSIVEGIVQPAASFGASMSNTENVLAAGGTKTINVTGNVSWTASATNGASVSPSSDAGVGSVTVTIPENETSSEKTYSVTISTSADVDPDSYSFTITQDAAPSVVNESTEADPYTPAEVVALIDQLSGGTMNDVYVYGIISNIVTAYSSTHHNISFDISIDGKTSGSQQFRVYKTSASSADDYVVGDAVELKGTVTKYNTTYEFTEGSSTLINILHMPTISPNGGSFTSSQSVTMSAASGSTIRYTTNGNDPTSNSSVYSSALSLTETTTVKAIATKGILTTGVVSATFTKSSGANTLVPAQTHTMADKGYANQANVATISGTNNCSIVFAKGTGTNPPKYYTSGTAVRAYAGNTITIGANTGYKITSIQISFGSSDGSNTISASTGTYSNGSWTGSIENGETVVFTIGGSSGNRRISAIAINN